VTDRFLVVLAFILATVSAVGAQPVSARQASCALERDPVAMRAEPGIKHRARHHVR